MQLGLPFRAPPLSKETFVALAGHPVRVEFVRNRRARHYILRLRPDGSLRVTMPWSGSRAEALRFVEERRDWIVRERDKHRADAARRGPWQAGTTVLFHGEACALRTAAVDAKRVRVTFADQSFLIPADRLANLRAPVEAWLRRAATVELPERLARLARLHAFDVQAVSIRNQRSRWGSCSATGRISLNWKLIQFPAEVTDYVLLHELVHLRHLNHSPRFWTEVARLCPAYQDARRWLRHHAGSTATD